MAVVAIPIVSRMQLRLNVGEDENSNPIYRTRSFSNVKTAADDEDIYELAVGLAGLQVHPLNTIKRVDEYELVDE